MHPSVSRYVNPEVDPNYSLQATIQQLVELLLESVEILDSCHSY
jgi:hypothetical protein